MEVYIGIDWSQNKHDIVFLNGAGARVARHTIPHNLEGFLKMDAIRQDLGVEPGGCLVGLETAHNLVIDFSWARGDHQVYVIPPNVVKSVRGRYSQSGGRGLPGKNSPRLNRPTPEAACVRPSRAVG